MPSLIGNKVNQVPSNGDLGTLAFQDSNAVNITGGVVDVSAGTAALPTLGTTGDPNTGVFFPAADTVAVATNGAERVRVDSNGNVGVGTVSPTVALHVNSAGTTQAIVQSNNQTTTYLRFINTTNNNGYVGYSGDNLVFLTTGAERMRIDASGNVGIGTTSPTRKLTVTGTTNAYMDFSSTSNRRYTVGSEPNGFVIYDDTAGAYRTVVDASGNLGVGTTTPSAKLDVNGAVNVTGNVKLTNSSATNIGLFNTAASAINYGLYSANTASNGFNGFGILDITNSVYRMIIFASGGVSIGNTTDAGAGNLRVNGKIKTGGYTVATLPAGVVGDRAYVTDALAPTYLGALVGGGAVTCPAFYNGTAWVSA